MRFLLTLELEHKEIPIDYRKIILSYIKNALSKCNDGKYFDYFFKDTNQKNYCFTTILPKPKFEKNNVLLDKKEIKILFSTTDNSKESIILFSCFIAQKNKKFPLPNGNGMTLKTIQDKKSKTIYNQKAIFKISMGSGLCVRDHNKEKNSDKYYIFTDIEFREKLDIVLKNQALKFGFSETDIANIKCNPIQCKKVVAKHYGVYIDTTVGMLEIQANSKILQYFYDCGIGSRKSAGFGMLDLVTQDLV